MNLQSGEQGSARPARTVHCDLGNLGPGNAAVETAIEVPRLDERAVTGSEHQTGVDPSSANPGPVGILLLLAELERGDAEVREGERSVGSFRFGLAAQELTANTLHLLPDVQLTRVEVD
jgi:hypothetical protein